MSKSETIQKKIYQLDAERQEAVDGFKARAVELNAELEEALAEEAADQEDS